MAPEGIQLAEQEPRSLRNRMSYPIPVKVISNLKSS